MYIWNCPRLSFLLLWRLLINLQNYQKIQPDFSAITKTNFTCNWDFTCSSKTHVSMTIPIQPVYLSTNSSRFESTALLTNAKIITFHQSVKQKLVELDLFKMLKQWGAKIHPPKVRWLKNLKSVHWLPIHNILEC